MNSVKRKTPTYRKGKRERTGLPVKNKPVSGSKWKGNKLNPFVILLVVMVAWSVLSMLMPVSEFSKAESVPLTKLFELIGEEKVEKVIIDNQTLKIELKNGDKFTSQKEPQISFFELLDLQGLNPSSIPGGIDENPSLAWLEIISNIAFPVASLIFIWWIFRSVGKTTGGAFGLGKSKAKLFMKDKDNKVGFNDVAGSEEVKKELFEIVSFLKKPEKYRKLGARIPRGALLIGPSGVGKTLLARAVAGEASVPFYSVAGSEFIEMIVGVGSARVRDLFKVAKSTAPSLVFIDEIDAIGRQRGRGAVGSNDEREQTLNQILVEMDGFDPRTNVIIIAATNRPDMLDPALVRPGRFDRHIRIDLPDVKEREGIIRIHMKGKPFAKTVNIEKLAKQTVGFSGADIENMLNEAAIFAARENKKEITAIHLSEASTKVKLGPQRKLLQKEEDRKVVAYHEAGHTLVGFMNPNKDTVTRVSIVSRSMSLGHTEYTPEGNTHNETRSSLLAKIEALLGGRAAEELVFNEETIGAANDIQKATFIAKKMVTDFGMSDLGPINFVSENVGMWDPSAYDRAIGYSEEVSRKIDEEVKRIIGAQYENSLKVLKKYRKKLDKLAEELLKKETLEQDEVEKIIKP